MAGSRPAVEQAVISNVKLARTLINARHRAEADDELNAVIPQIRLEMESQAQAGKVIGLSVERISELLYGKAAE